jgi:hypothetical protein
MDREFYVQLMLSNQFSMNLIDWLTVISLFVLAAFWLLAPWLGYTRSNNLLRVALWCLIIKMGLTLGRVILIHFLWFEETGYGKIGFGTSSPPRDPSSVLSIALYVLVPPMETALFVLAMFLFVLWLSGLRKREQPRSINDRA